ncbi:MAG: hypothetical protein R3A44_16595 [Caldilineaceae bacterium]
MTQVNECNQSLTLMEYGALPSVRAELAGVKLQRGMRVLDQNGVQVGHVAAVVVGHHEHTATRILLHEDASSPYRQCPIDLIRAVVNGDIQLRIVEQMVKSLPLWHNSNETR